MATKNKELAKQAREALSGKWGLAIGVIVVYIIIIQASTMAVAIGALIISGPMAVGLAIFSLAIARKQDATFNQLFEGFKNFGTALGTYLLYLLFVILWTLLFIIPGVIAMIKYSQAFYILAEDDSIGAMEAIDKSKAMMYGYKWKYVRLLCRFIGWALLCILTFGIGFLWLAPYVKISLANFYEDIKDNPIAKE
jgi:uncharacterized membrane protein